MSLPFFFVGVHSTNKQIIRYFMTLMGEARNKFIYFNSINHETGDADLKKQSTQALMDLNLHLSEMRYTFKMLLQDEREKNGISKQIYSGASESIDKGTNGDGGGDEGLS